MRQSKAIKRHSNHSHRCSIRRCFIVFVVAALAFHHGYHLNVYRAIYDGQQQQQHHHQPELKNINNNNNTNDLVNVGSRQQRQISASLKPVGEEKKVTISDVRNDTQQTDLQPVLHFPSVTDDGVEMQMELEGLSVSKAIHLINDSNASMLYPNIVWIGSPIPHHLCHMDRVREALEFYQRQNPGNATKSDWTVHLLDWGDGTSKLYRCTRLEKLIGKENVHYWKRSVVSGRYWDKTTQSIVVGQVITKLKGFPIRSIYIPTRTDVVQAISTAAAVVAASAATRTTTTTNQTMNAKQLTEYLVTKTRPGDVIHHWPADGQGVSRGSALGRTDWLRTTTSLTLQNMTLPPYNLNVFCGRQGIARDQGRRSVGDDYVQSMLHYKIMVVTQRDSYEGHFRLFEGLVSGAMVIHDRIISLPAGLEENVNIVFFDNQQELREKVMYYLSHDEERLAIARRGRQVAMCQSRTWHLMERIILGRSVTPCNE